MTPYPASRTATPARSRATASSHAIDVAIGRRLERLVERSRPPRGAPSPTPRSPSTKASSSQITSSRRARFTRM